LKEPRQGEGGALLSLVERDAAFTAGFSAIGVKEAISKPKTMSMGTTSYKRDGTRWERGNTIVLEPDHKEWESLCLLKTHQLVHPTHLPFSLHVQQRH